MCTVGDPLSDVANFNMIFLKVSPQEMAENPCLAQMFIDQTATGVLTERRFLELYCEKRRQRILLPEQDQKYAKAVNCLRFLAVFQAGLDDDDRHERGYLDRKKAVQYLIQMASELLAA
jgi:aminoglycoside phosphotransferase (APT) family kinase protein